MAVTLTALSGCSSVPDALNPAEWYNSTVDFFSGEDNKGQVADQDKGGAAQTNPGEGQPFPTLSSVPERPAKTIKKGLVADVEGRKYADAIARQGQPAQTTLARDKPTQAISAVPVQPTPPAIPVVSVAQAPTTASAIPVKPVQAPAPVLKAPQQTQVAALPAGLPANAMSPLDADPYATVIVSSNGIEMNGSLVSLPENSVAPSQQARQVSQQDGAASPAPTLRRYQSPASGGAKIATILFANGSDNLDSQDKEILSEVVLLHKERGGMVRVIGYSSSRTRNMDPVRHAMVNYKLSADRANMIAAVLVRKGVPADMLLVDSRSDTMPLYSESMPSGEAGNRRAEIYFVN